MVTDHDRPPRDTPQLGDYQEEPVKIQEARARAVAVADRGEMDFDQRAAVRLAAALGEIEHACQNMNKGAPGWMLVDTIMAIINGERDA